MLKQIEGSHAVAEAIALCRPQVICAYPITPQTHIVENLSELVKSGELSSCTYINAESESSALSFSVGACAAGARTYTATSSQGLLFMAEVLHNASGMSLPLVMTLGNRAIGGPINIWNDHSDAMAVRDSGWIMLFAENNQEAVDLHIQAFKIAESLSRPVMVCVDGFILTHAYERIDIPSQQEVDSFLPSFSLKQVLDPEHPCSIGAMVGPEAFTEVKYIAYQDQLKALLKIPEISSEFKTIFERDSGGLVHEYHLNDAKTVVIAMGSVCGTIKETIDDLRKENIKIGLLSICSFRPFPFEAIKKALIKAKNVLVLERAIEVGTGGIIAPHIEMALRDADVSVKTVVAGLGGRAITKNSLNKLFTKAISNNLELLSFLDLNTNLCKNC